jgi:hypothetical protein
MLSSGPLEVIAGVLNQPIFGWFCQDLLFDANSHTLESRGFASNNEDWQKLQKEVIWTSAITPGCPLRPFSFLHIYTETHLLCYYPRKGSSR